MNEGAPAPTPSLSVLRAGARLLSFRLSRDELLALDRRHLALSPQLDLVLEGRSLTTLHQTGGFSFGRRPNEITTVMLGVGV